MNVVSQYEAISSAASMTVRISVLVCIAGCATQSAKHVILPPPDDCATPAQIEHAKQQLRFVKADMTDEQVFETLGLWDLDKEALAGYADGSPSRFVISWVLDRRGHTLKLVEELVGPGKHLIVSAYLELVPKGGILQTA